MKRLTWVAVASLGAISLAGAPLACVSNTAAAPPGGEDSGTLPPVEDAAPQGTDGTMTPNQDSGVADSGVDTGFDAGPQPLTLTVLLGGAGESGVTVVFQDDTGAVLSTAETGASGSVSQLVNAGSQVTVLLGTPQGPNLVTIQSVAPGDTITVVDSSGNNGTQALTDTVAATLPAGTWDASAVSEDVYIGSCYNPLPYSVSLYSDCVSGNDFPILALALDDATGNEIAYTYQTANPLVPDGGLPDGDTTIPAVVSRAWSSSSATETIAATNIPPLPLDAGPGGVQGGFSAFYTEVSGGIPTTNSAYGNASDDAGAASAQFVVHVGYPDFVQATAYQSLETDYTNFDAFVGGATRTAAPTATQSASFDLSTLPLITGTSTDSSDGGTPTQPIFTWTTAGSISGADGIFVSAQWSSYEVTEAGSTYVNGTWTVYAPPSATTVVAPTLPASALAPSSTASWTQPRMAAIQSTLFSGYATFRARAGTLPLLQNYTITIPTLPANGTIYVSAFYVNEG